MCTGGEWGASNDQGESGWGDQQAGQGWGDEDPRHGGNEGGAAPKQASPPPLLSAPAEGCWLFWVMLTNDCICVILLLAAHCTVRAFVRLLTTCHT